MELVTALLLPILLVELYTWLPAISEWVLEFNVRRLCVENREQFREEWKANLDAFPNTIVKLIHALSYTVAASKINKELFDDNLATIGQKLQQISDTHRIDICDFQNLKSNTLKTNQIINDFELSLREKVAALGTTPTPCPELRDQAQDSFEKLGHAYLGAFNRATTLLNTMLAKHNAKLDEVGRSIQLFNKKYCDVTKFNLAGWRASQISACLKDLEDAASSLLSIVDKERECEENDEYMKQLEKITAVIRQTRLQLQPSVPSSDGR
jgi:hypothetical protein